MLLLFPGLPRCCQLSQRRPVRAVRLEVSSAEVEASQRQPKRLAQAWQQGLPRSTRPTKEITPELRAGVLHPAHTGWHLLNCELVYLFTI